MFKYSSNLDSLERKLRTLPKWVKLCEVIQI